MLVHEVFCLVLADSHIALVGYLVVVFVDVASDVDVVGLNHYRFPFGFLFFAFRQHIY